MTRKSATTKNLNFAASFRAGKACIAFSYQHRKQERLHPPPKTTANCALVRPETVGNRPQ